MQRLDVRNARKNEIATPYIVLPRSKLCGLFFHHKSCKPVKEEPIMGKDKLADLPKAMVTRTRGTAPTADQPSPDPPVGTRTIALAGKARPTL